MSVIIDADPTRGRPFSDIDDVLAIAFAHAAGVAIESVTSVWGNACIEHTHATARWITQRYGIQAHRGAARPGDHATDAARALAAHTGTVIALGPLTNIAAALERGAEWERLIVLGGTTSSRLNLRPLHTTEFNLAVDRDAAAQVLPHVTDLVLMEPCRRVWFGRTHLSALPAAIRRGAMPWLLTAPLRGSAFRFHPWDVLAIAALTHPECLRATLHGVTLDPSRRRAGRVHLSSGKTRVVRDIVAEQLHTIWFDVIRNAAQPV